ncbi:glycoside hydrolase family 3 C-terminal domain-containing protein [Ruminococcaceae bacterium OttesenSCG-928-D13]|nr:glycoside hydrolase family 3 C-terminal domain-containing protein [Ruminococcaceae bacterium OttesenSCG-928-D13]
MEEYIAYKDESLSPKERAADLAARMTVRECAAQLLFESVGVERLGVKDYNWWNEALHGVARAGMATVFPQAIGLGATFSPEWIGKMAEVIATEGRAKFNQFQKYEDYGIYKGITYWSPNVNIFRDPRWGRGQETYGEDPTLTAELGVAFVKGLQGDGPVMKTAACAKHFAVHSGPEHNRHEFDAKASPQDMAETYLPAFKALCDAGVEGFMGAYNRTNGEPCCGSPTLLTKLLREEWGFDGYITSDCWAIADFHLHHKVTANAVESVALALENGCDLNCGNVYVYLMDALEAGAITEEQIRQSAARLLATKMKLGMFDAGTPYDDIPYDVVDCDAHRRLNEEIARRSLVLLKNNDLLPVKKESLKNVAVIGPNANSITALLGNYHGTGNQYHTVLEAVRQALPGVRVNYSKGSHMYEHKLEDPGYDGDCLSEVKTQCAAADLVVLVVGLDETVEGEEMGREGFTGDKKDLLLPKTQRDLVRTCCESGTPVVLVNMTGSAVDFEAGNAGAGAIIQAWYPGAVGGKAVADLIFGEYSPSGKLPVTFYRDGADLPDFEDYSMENRTYKFYKDEPLYPFGFGLGYSRFAFSGLELAGEAPAFGAPLRCAVTVENTGTMAAEEVVQLYLRHEAAGIRTPRHRLCAFTRVALQPGERRQVAFELEAEALELIDENGKPVRKPGRLTLFAGGCQPDAFSEQLYGTPCAALAFELDNQ